MGMEKEKMNIEPLIAFGLGVYELLILAGIGIGLIAVVVTIIIVFFAIRR